LHSCMCSKYLWSHEFTTSNTRFGACPCPGDRGTSYPERFLLGSSDGGGGSGGCTGSFTGGGGAEGATSWNCTPVIIAV
jgi:hypothetical protein